MGLGPSGTRLSGIGAKWEPQVYSGTDHNVVQLAHADEPLRAVADLSAEKLLFRWCATQSKAQCIACSDGAWGATRKHAAGRGYRRWPAPAPPVRVHLCAECALRSTAAATVSLSVSRRRPIASSPPRGRSEGVGVGVGAGSRAVLPTHSAVLRRSAVWTGHQALGVSAPRGIGSAVDRTA